MRVVTTTFVAKRTREDLKSGEDEGEGERDKGNTKFKGHKNTVRDPKKTVPTDKNSQFSPLSLRSSAR